MAEHWSDIYFDKQDRDILALVNHILDSRTGPSDNGLFDPNLHPHGIKELAASPVARMASAVVNLLRNLEAGDAQARDRLLALEVLYDEVLNSAHSLLRRNTARVLMQIMKDMVRAHGDRLTQLKLAHDFRRTVQGTPRIVRHMLARYHLPEMPEEWNQIAFDDHVYDANTKGRKTPTHLIMDAWIKGIRDITIGYEYWVPPDAAREILRASEITGLTVRIGIEYQVPYYGHYARLFWIPRGFSSNEDFLEFLHNPKLADMMKKGREVLSWKKARILRILNAWNDRERPRLSEAWGVEVPPLDQQDFLDFVGRGQPSMHHLSEFLHRHVLPAARERAERLAKSIAGGTSEGSAAKEEIDALENLSADIIADEWLSAEALPEVRELLQPGLEDVPELLRLSPHELVRELQELNPGYRLVLGLTDLRVEDVAEILSDCHGAITHLEIFNMRAWLEGRLHDLEAIGELQRALNLGLGPRVKQMIRQMGRHLERVGDDARAAKFKNILRNVPKLWEHYRHSPLKSRLGTSSGGRRSYGMGLVLKETLSPRALAELRRKPQQARPIPLCSPVEETEIFREPENPTFWQRLAAHFRRIPGCRHLGMERKSEWKTASEYCRICKHGNIANLGGLNQARQNDLLGKSKSGGHTRLGLTYLNSSISNWLKVLLGFIPAFFSFIYTQDWWFLAWFGTFIWFGITGVRNVVQMMFAANGFSRGTLIHWKDQVSISRICDSLMYTGISVLLLEVMVRVWLLQDWLGYSVENHSTLVFTVLNIVNGFYICAHNVFRGFPKEAAIGNFFRSGLAIPVSSLYDFLLFQLLLAVGVAQPEIYLVPSAAVVSKMASDTVAAIIEGYADSQVNLRMRRWDYKSKIANVFACYTRLELLFPQEDALVMLARPGGLKGHGGSRGRELEKAFIINALDLMYFWYYQPRAQDAFRKMLVTMPDADRHVLARAQLVLTREREISQMLVDGLLGRNFSPPLAFFLSKHMQYLRLMSKLCRPHQHRAHHAVSHARTQAA
ncbi:MULTISPECIES: hypothetical protein [unclassified Desulfovibrio]|uniref:hypothetical protein n=1 Tax=unclassified Desulfovibrio TaxID=2593640 RepID=UPI0013ECCE07|nr:MULTISPECIES: hypothetical protein [unclassified Desulfovibrio]